MSPDQATLFQPPAVTADVRALALIQPWLDGVLDGGKPIENRVKWRGSSFRGPVYLHASKRSPATRVEYDAALRFVMKRGIAWRPKPYAELECGGIIGRAIVIGVVDASGTVFVGTPDPPMFSRQLTGDERLWWLGAFALVLTDVERVPFVPCKGALGFFRPPADVVAQLQAHR